MQMPFFAHFISTFSIAHMAVSPHRGRHRETSCWASGHIKIPPSVVNWVCVYVCVCGRMLVPVCNLPMSVLALISQPRSPSTDPWKSDYCLGWSEHGGTDGQTSVPKREKGLLWVLGLITQRSGIGERFLYVVLCDSS